MVKGTGIALVFIALLTNVAEVQAQCVPDTDVQGLYSPTSAEGLPDAYIGQQYEAVISLKVPSDTAYLTYNFSVDSLVLTDVQGLPAGFTWECSPPSCGFPGGDYGCILLTGLSNDEALIGDHDLVAQFNFHIRFGAITYALPYEINDYTLKLLPFGPAGVSDITSDEAAFLIEPNPVTTNSRLRFSLPVDGTYTVTMFSLLGAEVGHVQGQGKRGASHSLPIADFIKQPGVYFLSLNQGDYTRSLRFVVQ